METNVGTRPAAPPTPRAAGAPAPRLSHSVSDSFGGAIFFFLSFGTAKKDEEPISRSL